MFGVVLFIPKHPSNVWKKRYQKLLFVVIGKISKIIKKPTKIRNQTIKRVLFFRNTIL